MKIAIILAALLVGGCASTPVPYDQQFSTLDSVDANGLRRSHAWIIGPSVTQRAMFKHKWYPSAYKLSKPQ
jgi:hypothetical protein